MPSFSLFRRHSWFAAHIDAYADGELQSAESARLAGHLASCERCRAAVQDAAALKAALARLPEVAPSRSFRLTPAMVAQQKPAPALARSTPLYLNLARAGAGLSVAAFAAVYAFAALDSENPDSETSGAIQMSAATDSPGAESASRKGATEVATPFLAPAAGAGASGSGIPTPTMVSIAPLASATALSPPDAPSSGDREAAERDDSAQETGAHAEDAAVAGDDDDGLDTLATSLGVLAAASLLLLAGLEVKRRFRRV